MAREPRNTRTEDDGSDHKYFAMIPHTITRGKRGRGLSLPARWLYVYLKSVTGESRVCDKSTTTIVKEAQLGRGTIGPAKDELVKAGLITMIRREGKYHATDHIRLVDIWPENMQEFGRESCTPDEQLGCTLPVQPRNCTPDEQPVSSIDSTKSLSSCTPDEQLGCTPPVLGCTPGVLKKKDLKNQDPDLGRTPPYSPPAWEQNGCVGVYGAAQDVTAGIFNQNIKANGSTILAYLNKITGMTYTNARFIEAILRDGATVEDSILTIDWWNKKWTVDHPNQRDHFDSATPFKKDIFEKNLPKAQKWQQQRQQPPRGSLQL